MAAFTPKPGFRFDGFPPKEALEFFRAKGWKVGFDYRDVWREEHAAAFTVAKAMSLDVLQAIREEVDRALAEGRTLRQFQDDLQPKLEALGWWGRKELTDPLTGETVEARLGSPRRLRTIYRANLRTARAAGQWERIERTKATHPFLLYRIGPSKEHRVEHLAWDGLLLPVDDPWWTAHMPPNGWGCKCFVRQVSRPEATRLQKTGVPDLKAPPILGEDGLPTGHRLRVLKPVLTEAPPVKTRRWLNRRTGQVEQVPEGIDPGWDTNPAKARLAAFTPPERDNPPESFPPGVSAPPLPPPRQAPASKLLEEGLPPERYARAFLDEFGAAIGKPVVHVDQVGQPVVISERLLQTRFGQWKADKRGRGPAMRLLADTIKAPDEIWWNWFKSERGWELHRRYIARWEIEGQTVPGMALFEWGASGWSGVTAFDPERRRYIENKRTGILAYRRKG